MSTRVSTVPAFVDAANSQSDRACGSGLCGVRKLAITAMRANEGLSLVWNASEMKEINREESGDDDTVEDTSNGSGARIDAEVLLQC